MTVDEEKLQEQHQPGDEMYDGRLRPQSCSDCRAQMSWGPEICASCLSRQVEWASPEPEGLGLGYSRRPV